MKFLVTPNGNAAWPLQSIGSVTVTGSAGSYSYFLEFSTNGDFTGGQYTSASTFSTAALAVQSFIDLVNQSELGATKVTLT